MLWTFLNNVEHSGVMCFSSPRKLVCTCSSTDTPLLWWVDLQPPPAPFSFTILFRVTLVSVLHLFSHHWWPFSSEPFFHPPLFAPRTVSSPKWLQVWIQGNALPACQHILSGQGFPSIHFPTFAELGTNYLKWFLPGIPFPRTGNYFSANVCTGQIIVSTIS